MATNIRFQGLVKTTAEIESDKFAGRIGWNTTLARFVAYYNATQYATMARRDVLETFAAGIQDSTLGVGLPMFAGTAGRLSTESVASFRSRLGLHRNGGREWSIRATSRTSYRDFRYSQMAWSGAVFVQMQKDTDTTLYRYSSDALTWTEAAMPVSANWTGVVWCAFSGLFVAVGYSSGGAGRIYTSPNGVTWTARTTTATYLYGIAVSGAVLVACSNGGASIRSADGGFTWAGISPAYYNNVVFLNGKFILVQGSSGNGTVTSTDGATWDTPVAHAMGLMALHSAHPMVYFGGRYWCGGDGVGPSDTLMVSTDGKTWVSATSVETSLRIPIEVTAWVCFAATPSNIFAVVETAADETLVRSDDGVIWETVGPCDRFQNNNLTLSNIEYLPSMATLLATGYTGDKNFSAFAYA